MEFEKMKKTDNPLYPPKKEKTEKELLMAIGTTVVCLFLVSVIIKNFNYAAIAQRQREKMEEYPQQTVTEEVVPEEEMNEEFREGDSEGPVYDIEEYTEESSEEETAEVYTEEAAESEYILDDSSERLISEEELWDFSQEELNYARNEIYARYGRRFKD